MARGAYGQYGRRDMENALRDLDAGLSLRAAEAQHGVPRSTLHNRRHQDLAAQRQRNPVLRLYETLRERIPDLIRSLLVKAILTFVVMVVADIIWPFIKQCAYSASKYH